ncbi:MAG: Uma2 family endonuclease [Deltaproteobacteria bacterium]|nr:Uma2 family endonuclease [Deltaproteobacteria bacterium]
MSQAAVSEEKYTYSDYLGWPEGERWELIEGTPYNTTPAPSIEHQGISGEIFRQICNFLFDKGCGMFVVPLDVRLPEADEADEEITTVVQPDIAVICDPAKLDNRGCRGAPDMIIEVLSPATVAKDQIEKVDLYEKNGVKEYWLIHPTDRLVTVRLLGTDGRYGIPNIKEAKGLLPLRTLAGLEIDLDAVFRRVVAP